MKRPDPVDERTLLEWVREEQQRRLKAAEALRTSLVMRPDHVLSDLLLKRARYKIFWGGRGAAKSMGIIEAAVREADMQEERYLCTREYQNSIRDSSHKLIKDTIYRLGREHRFKVGNDYIRNPQTKAEFLFKGLHNNEQSVRSTQGITRCLVEEAQAVSEGSWRALVPTIRDPGSEFWIAYNLIDEKDATHQRFVIKPRSRSIIHKINYDSNPHFPEELRQEMEDDKARDYHLYEHIWLGEPLRLNNAQVYGGRWRVEEFPDNLWTYAPRLFFGADFGFSQDPATLIRFFVYNRKLYIEYEAYATGVELSEYDEFYKSVPGSKDWPIKADCARPETISHISNTWGYNITGAEKWEGCIKDGITHIRGYDEIIIHPRCAKTANEARLYRYKVDDKKLDEYGQPEVLPIIVDKFNHAWDAVRYGLDGHIQKSGSLSQWERLGGKG